MKWLLITTIGKNPGDEWIRIGIQRIIQELDPDAEYILLDKESPSMRATVVDFDKCIWCGMPVFWSHGENRNNNMAWWKELMLGWVSERKNDFLVLGAGSFFPLDVTPDQIVYKKELVQSARDVLNRSYRVTARDTVVSKMTEAPIPAMLCQAIFSIIDYKQSNELKLANLMPDGSHYRGFGPGQATIWDIKKLKIARILLENNFTFIAHNLSEFQLAQKCGWKKIIPYNGDPYGLLKYYGRCGKFFGNRIHGSIVARGNNADVWDVGYDSRIEAVRLSGAKVSSPSEINLDEVAQWAAAPAEIKPFDMETEFNKQLNIVKEFMQAGSTTKAAAKTSYSIAGQPAGYSERSDKGKVLIVRPDSIGDFVIFSGILPYLRQLYKDAEITILLQQRLAELAESCPFIDKVVTFNRKKLAGDKEYSNELIKRLRAQEYDVAIYPVYSRDGLGDFLTLNCGAKVTIASYGDNTNISVEEKLNNDRLYMHLVPAGGVPVLETLRNDEFMMGLGIRPDGSCRPVVWITEDDRAAAQKLLDELQVENPIVVCPFSQHEIKDWPIDKWAMLLDNYRPRPILICGTEDDSKKVEQIINLTGHPDMHNICGRTTLRQLAALLEKAAVCISVDSAAGHIAAAVDCPQVIIIGGGHFGRFMPYSPTTTLVCLPMTCYNCNWICPYKEQEVFCISKIKVETVDRAVQQVLNATANSHTEPLVIEQTVNTDRIRLSRNETEESKPTKISKVSLQDNLNPSTRPGTRYLVTAIVSTYNSEKHIAGCLDDLESQTIADRLEIIVVDSGSKQNEKAVVQQFQKKYHNIRYIRTEQRETVYSAWNRAIGVACGKYITNANTDDRYRKDTLEVMVKTLEANPEIAVVYSDQQWVDELGNVVEQYSAPEYSRYLLLSDKCYVSSNPMWRKSVHDEFGLFEGDLFFVSGDKEFWLRVSQKYDFLHIGETLGIRRFTPDCISRKNVEERDGIDHLETGLILKCYHYAMEKGFTIDSTGLSGNPEFAEWFELRLLKEKIRAKLEDRKINPSDYIKDLKDYRKNNHPKLSIVIDCLNRKASLINNLNNLNKQSEKDFEVIVVNRGREQGDIEIAADKVNYDLCRVNLKEDFGSSFARNIGINTARAEFVAFLDEDSVANPDFVKSICENFSKHKICGIRGKIRPLNEKFSIFSPDYYDLGDEVFYTACETETNCAFRKDVLTRTGGFDEDLSGFSSQELSYKTFMLEGEKIDGIMYFPEVIVYQDYIRDVSEWSAKSLESRIGKILVTRKWLWQKYNLGFDSYLELMRSNYPINRNRQETDFKKLLNIAIILQERNAELAIGWAQRAVAANPSVGKGYYLLGSLYFRLGRLIEAEPILEKTLDLLVPAIISKPTAQSQRELEKYQGSQGCYVSCCTMLAHCYMAKGDFKKLKDIYNHMLTNHHLELPNNLRRQIEGLVDKLTGKDVRAQQHEGMGEQEQINTGIQRISATPLVSAIISTYNAERHIAGCLEDLESQTIADRLEIIVVNSGSEQNEEKIIKEFQRKYDNIVYIKTEHREGVYKAWNRAVAVARGKYLTNANTDDRHRKDALEIMAKVMDAEPDIALVYGDQIVTETENDTFEDNHGTEKAQRADFSRERLIFGCCVGSQPMWRKELHKQFGYFDETLTCAGDWDFWLRISRKYGFKHIPEFLGLYYKNEQGLEHGKKIHSLYERYVVGKRYGNPYISVIPIYEHKDNPLVSVIMPVYNGEKYIASAVECVLIQNYRNFELIIIDDGSEDNTKQIIEGFKDEKIRYFGKKNAGPAAARNVGIKNSQGQFVVLLDADDMMTPDFISGHLQEFEKRPDADLIYCDDCLIDEKDKPIRVIRRPEYKDSRKVIQDLFSSGFPVVPFRTCIRKEVFEKIGLYDEELIVAEDYDMIRRFVKQQLKLYHLPRALYLRRLTSGGLSRSFSEEKARSHFEVVRRIAETFEYDELFPGLKWEKIAPENRQMHLRCLVAATLLGIGQSYKLANSPGYALMAIDLARKEIKECIKAEPENQMLQQLINRCRLYESQLPVKSAEGRQKAYQPA